MEFWVLNLDSGAQSSGFNSSSRICGPQKVCRIMGSEEVLEPWLLLTCRRLRVGFEASLNPKP